MANWIIDRTINLDEYKTRAVLNELLVEPRKTDEELEIILHKKGVLKNEGDGALRRRWYTYLRNYGLLVSDNVTEMGKLYASSQLSLQELALLQLVKKQIKLANDEKIFPLKVLIGVLSNLASQNIEEAYITREEFTNYIVNVQSDRSSDINKVTNSILVCRNNGLILTNIEGQHDDIWFNSLSQTKLFDYFGHSLYVSNFRVLSILNNYFNNQLTLPINFGIFEFGLIDNIVLPSKMDLPFDLTYAKNDRNAGEVLFDFFFNDISLRKIEEKYYGIKKQYSGVKTLLSKLKIDISNKGLYLDYKNYPNIIILKLIKSGDVELMEVAKIMQNITANGKNDVQEEIPNYDNCDRITGGTNVILYGVPGAGKSWTIEHEYKDENTKMERVVFHPDYTYSDFVGQILPKKKGDDISYDFIPGPFTKIMREAYHNPNKKFILAIEEINRGNAPAIFGDIFQLLDRDKNGTSSFEIMNSDIAREMYDDENHVVSIPSNLTLLCTMNTSDQNVFTLDTAFQRRWNMRLIENSFRKETKEERDFAAKTILDTSVKWEAFCNAINNQILEKNQNMTSSEDKRLGTHFVSLDDLTMQDENNLTDSKENKLKNRRFPEKVIKYLWDDAFKFYRDEIFKGELNSLEKVISVFTTKTKDDRFDIFKDNIRSAIFDENKK